MTRDLKKELEEIEDRVANLKLERARLEERKKQLDEQIERVRAELKVAGIEDETELPAWLAEEEKKLKEELEKCKRILDGKDEEQES
jgi:ABC-type phosphate transport system auxiliary subunit